MVLHATCDFVDKICTRRSGLLNPDGASNERWYHYAETRVGIEFEILVCGTYGKSDDEEESEHKCVFDSSRKDADDSQRDV